MGADHHRVWTERHVRRELEAFLAGRDEWPRAVDFADAGKSVLRRAVARYGGPRRRAGSRRAWTDARIEAQLRRFLAGRDVWPPVGEFNDAGLAPLFTAVYTYGGVERWAARMGVARRPVRNPGRPAPRWTHARI